MKSDAITFIVVVVVLLLMASIYIIMPEKRRKSLAIAPFLVRIPEVPLSILCLIVFTVVVFLVAYTLDSIDPSSAIAYFLFGILSASACFFMIRRNPSSVWYVPLIINIATILPAFLEDFWGKPPEGIPMGIPIVGGWILTILASILGVLKGRKRMAADKP